MTLYSKYRPRDLKQFVGPPALLESLEEVLGRKHSDIPHAFLFYGPRGCGKTTLGRIVANKLGCSKNDFMEMDSAEYTGVDHVRAIRQGMWLAPMAGKVRVILMDECFAKGTRVYTPSGFIKIEDVRSGDRVFSCMGNDTVVRAFRNRVCLSRLVRLRFSNGAEIFTTKDHLFYTDFGWKKAIDLNVEEDLIFGLSCDLMYFKGFEYKSQTGGRNEEKKEEQANIGKCWLSVVWKSFQEKEARSKDMLPILWSKNKKLLSWIGRVCVKGVFTLRKSFYDYQESKKAGVVLFPFLREKMGFPEPGFSGKIAQSGCVPEDFSKSETLLPKEFGSFHKSTLSSFKENDGEQSFLSSELSRKGKKYQKDKGNSSCLERGKGGKREADGTTSASVFGSWLANRGCCPFGKESKRVSDKLQVGSSQSEVETWYRSGWTGTQFEGEAVARLEKGRQIERIRLESVEIYEPGRNDESFRSVVSDQERDSGFVIFYDLQMKNHPSYFANGMLVHNCHRLSPQAMDALLKALEDPPDHVYFVLATTEPHKLTSTIRSRCVEYKVGLLGPEKIKKVVERVLKKEGKELDGEVLNKLVKSSEGSPRTALTLLEQVINLKPKEALEVAERFTTEEGAVIDLCRCLLNNPNWGTVCKILSNLEEEPETVRRMIRGYFNKVLLNGKNHKFVWGILDCFSDPCYDQASLTAACYDAVFSGRT